MKLLYLAPTFDETNGWGRYASGFLREAQKRLGKENVIAPDPSTLSSKEVRWKTPFLAVMDKKRLSGEAARCDVIHAASETLAPLALLLSMKTAKPFIVSAHGTYADLATYRWYVRWLYRAAFARAAAIVPVSAYTERLVKSQLPDVPTEVIPGGFEPSASNGRKENHEGFRILSVGALKPRKGFHTLIDAFSGLRGDVRLDIVGSDGMVEYAEKLRSMISEKGLESRVTLHGRVAEEKLDALYAEADLFVLPSEHDGTAFEGLGLVYLEALAHGVPVIGSRDSGAEDVIRDGVNGFLVEPGNPEELAGKIAQLHGNPEMLSMMGSKGSESINDFRWQVVGEKMHELYISCLA